MAAAALLGLGGCGVGVGGTGTGEELAPFGATAASVCGASIAPALSCPAAGSTAAAEGTAPRLFIDAEGNGRVIARLEGNRVELDARCAGQAFSGTWGVGQDQMSRYFGTATSVNEKTPQLAVLQVTLVPSGNGRELLMELSTTRGQPLLPLQRFRAVDTLPSPLPSCP